MKPSLFDSFIRRTKVEDPKFRERQSGWFYRLKQRIIIFGSIIVVGVIVYWIQSMPKVTVVDSTKQIKKSGASTMLDKRQKLSTRDLIFMASEMDIDPDAPLPVIMDYIKDRNEIADKLLAKSNDELAQKEGTLFRIEALQNLSKLNRTHSMGYSTVDKQLYELCSANLSHRDPEVSKMAAVAIMITSWDEFSFEPTTANLNNALSKCNQVASQLNDDDEIAKAIYAFASLKKRSEVTVDDSIEFFNVVIKHFQNSKNDDAKDFARKAYREILFGSISDDEKFRQLLVAGIKDRFRQQRRSVENELNNRLRFAMRTDYFDSDALQQLMQLLEIFPTVGRIESATEMAIEVREFFDSLPDGTVKTDALSSIAGYQARINNVEKTLDLGQLKPLGQQNNDWLKPRNSLILFWSADDKQSAVYLRALKNLGIQRVLQCIVIVVNQDPESMQTAKKLDKEIDGFIFVVNAEKGGDGEIIEGFPVPSAPYILLLDENLQLSVINPDLRGLGKTIEAMLK